MALKRKAVRESAEDKLGREAFIMLFLVSGRLTGDVERLCRKEQIAMSHYTVLWFLARRSETDGVPMGAVIDGHLNRASDSTRLADRLTALGMIERLASPTDRRVVLVRLTDKGRETYVRLTRGLLTLHKRQWGMLTQDELRQLRRLLVKVLADDVAKQKLTALAIGGE